MSKWSWFTAMDRVEGTIFAAGCALIIRVAMHFLDEKRIRQEVQANGARVVSITWNPFGRGWFFEKNERHYAVNYIDRSGNVRSGTCKTSLFTEVYWAEAPATEEPRPRFLSRHHCAHCAIRSTVNGVFVRIAVRRRKSPAAQNLLARCIAAKQCHDPTLGVKA